MEGGAALPHRPCTFRKHVMRPAHRPAPAALRELVEGVEPTDRETLEELRRWGWVIPASLELTGVGRSHSNTLRGGVLKNNT